jgi:RNA polymerase sigma-70 factor (ECF subfamily)
MNTVINRHRENLFNYINTIVKNGSLAEDILQEVFLKSIQKINEGEYKETGKFLPWISQIAHNRCMDIFRANKRIPEIKSYDNSYELLLNHNKPEIEKVISREYGDKIIKKLIDLLPPKQKEVVFMRHYRELSFRDIAEETNCSINTALGRMRYALINLRRMLNVEPRKRA